MFLDIFLSYTHEYTPSRPPSKNDLSCSVVTQETVGYRLYAPLPPTPLN